jgi:hypothetical protein
MQDTGYSPLTPDLEFLLSAGITYLIIAMVCAILPHPRQNP